MCVCVCVCAFVNGPKTNPSRHQSPPPTLQQNCSFSNFKATTATRQTHDLLTGRLVLLKDFLVRNGQQQTFICSGSKFLFWYERMRARDNDVKMVKQICSTRICSQVQPLQYQTPTVNGLVWTPGPWEIHIVNQVRGPRLH